MLLCNRDDTPRTMVTSASTGGHPGAILSFPSLHSAARLSLTKNCLCAAQDDQSMAHARASAASVTACATQSTNQIGDKQYVGILARFSALYGCIRELSLTDYFLERRITKKGMHSLKGDVKIPSLYSLILKKFKNHLGVSDTLFVKT